MAKATIHVRVALKLDHDEATWLRALLQNPLSRDPETGDTLFTEDPRDQKFREAIFAALPHESVFYIS